MKALNYQHYNTLINKFCLSYPARRENNFFRHEKVITDLFGIVVR